MKASDSVVAKKSTTVANTGEVASREAGAVSLPKGSDRKEVLFRAAWELYLELRPDTPPIEVGALPSRARYNTNDEFNEALDAYKASLEEGVANAMKSAKAEARTLWKVMFGDDPL